MIPISDQIRQPLLKTKLSAPQLRESLVYRPRLHSMLAESTRRILTLISAPAGYGKTTLLAKWIASLSTRPESGSPALCWLSLDEADNDLVRFQSYLLAALLRANIEISPEVGALLHSFPPPPPQAILTLLINQFEAWASPIYLVLDDYQFISNPVIHESLTFLLDHAPTNLHLVLATRSDPPLPLSRLRARNQLVEVRAADLRFTLDEVADFLNKVMQLSLSPEEISTLESRTEGWVTGLQMAALSMTGRPDVTRFIQTFSGSHRYILDYLIEEVLNLQPESIQRFLVLTSVLERLCPALCASVLVEDEQTCQATLAYLEQSNLFLVALDEERYWYRYHHLFGDLLKVRLHQAHPDLVPLQHIRASVWLEQKGFIPEAIQHLFAAGESDRAADLIERYGPPRLAESDPSVLQMAERLPPEILTDRPKIGLYYGWLLINQGNIEKALPLLHHLARGLAGASSSVGQQWMQTLIRLALAFLTPPSSTPGFDPLPDYPVLDEIPAGEPILRDAADILYGMTLGRRGDLDRAVEFSVKSIHSGNSTHGTQPIPTLVPFLATIYVFQGRLHAAASLCHEFLDPINAKGIRFLTAGNLDVVLGYVLYEWNRLEEAEAQIRDGLRANEPWGNIMTDAFGLLDLAHVLKAKGDYAGAMQVVEKFETRLQDPTRPVEFAEDFRTLRVRVQLASGDLHSAAQWADQVQLSEDFHLHQKYYRLTLARIRLAQGSYATVEKMLTGISSLDLSGNRINRQLESSLLLAAALAGQQRLPEAFGCLESCLTLAEPEGYIRAFVDLGKPVRELLAAYLRLDDPGHQLFAQKVLSAFPITGEAAFAGPQPAGLIEPLSARELEVLHLMALGRTNQEIAGQLIVATGTIKAHAASIYRKLDAANRTEAVARARLLGLLP